MSPLVIGGQICLWLGFLAAALASVLNLERDTDVWWTIPWIHYMGAMLVGVAGVIMLRMSASQFREDTDRTDADFSTISGSLTELLSRVSELNKRVESMRPVEIVNFIDDKCSQPFADFADSRSALSNRYDLQFFADVMTQFASAERYINRAWSAGADGYIDEVISSVKIALAHLEKCQLLLDIKEKTV